jgi:hypothetical protein
MNDALKFLGSYRGKYLIIMGTGVCGLLIEVFYHYVLDATASTQIVANLALVGSLLISTIGEEGKERLALRAAWRVLVTSLLYTILFLAIGGVAERLLLGDLLADDPRKGSVHLLFISAPAMFVLTAALYSGYTGAYLLLKKIGP